MKRKLILPLIIVLAFLLRFWGLGDYPAFNADEAAIGYNAYSLIETGKDEHGNPWPIHFQSFNDFKPGLYFYIVLPFIKVFGLNIWSVRAPAAFLGVLTVYLVYLLVKELFRDEKLSLISSFFLAISPWHIHFSRGGWEVNVATFFITLGILLFLKALKNPKYYLCSTVSFVASFYTYHAARVIIPLMGFGFLLLYKKKFKKDMKKVVLALVVGFVLTIPLLLDLTRGAVFSRAAGVGLFADPGPLSRINEQRGEHVDFQGYIPKVMHNKVVNYGLAFLENLTDHYHGEFLFLSGDIIERNRVPETGQMHLFDIAFLLTGFVFIVKKPKGWKTILLWLLVAPTAAALTFQSPHALRAHNMVIPLVIISAFGLTSLLNWTKTIKIKKVSTTFSWSVIVVISLFFLRYVHVYWTHMSKEYPFSSQYGVKELVDYIKENGDSYKNIIVTDRYDQPYIQFLFYLKYPPKDFQNNHELTPRDGFGFSTVREFDKYRFESISFEVARDKYPNSLIVGTDKEIQDEANIIKEIYFPNGETVFKIVAN